jgi:hypothetical protein
MAFAQYARTTKTYSLSLVDGTGVQLPTIGPPVWAITSMLNLDSTPAPYALISLNVSPDGLRATIQTADRAGTVTVAATAQLDGRGTVTQSFTLNIGAAPVVAPGAVTVSFAQAAPGPI